MEWGSRGPFITVMGSNWLEPIRFGSVFLFRCDMVHALQLGIYFSYNSFPYYFYIIMWTVGEFWTLSLYTLINNNNRKYIGGG